MCNIAFQLVLQQCKTSCTFSLTVAAVPRTLSPSPLPCAVCGSAPVEKEYKANSIDMLLYNEYSAHYLTLLYSYQTAQWSFAKLEFGLLTAVDVVVGSTQF